jgi:hypothetical protein
MLDEGIPRQTHRLSRVTTRGALFAVLAIASGLGFNQWRTRSLNESNAPQARTLSTGSVALNGAMGIAAPRPALDPSQASEETLIEQGYVPATLMGAPRAAPPPPPTSKAPLDPALTPWPRHNPGGVDGDRPPRSLPGIAGIGR